VPEPGRIGGVLPAAPIGYTNILTDYVKPDQRFVTCPNQDTVYDAGFFRLDTQPALVQVPDFGERFFTYQIVDHRRPMPIGKALCLCVPLGTHWPVTLMMPML